MDLSSGKVCSVKLNFRWLKKMVALQKKRTLELFFFSVLNFMKEISTYIHLKLNHCYTSSILEL